MASRPKSIADQLGLGRPKRRPARVAQAIQQELALLFLRGLKDPRLQQATITEVEVTPDLRRAVVYYDTPEAEAEAVAAGLGKARGYIRSQLAQVLNLRYMPELVFKRDLAGLRQARIESLLREEEEERGPSSE